MNIIQAIDEEIRRLERKKANIQAKCSHPDVTSVNKGDSGNPDTGREASYWTDNTCNLCGHKWTGDQ